LDSGDRDRSSVGALSAGKLAFGPFMRKMAPHGQRTFLPTA
jgi:hypothetical protein